MEDSHLACLDIRRGESSRTSSGATGGSAERVVAAFAVFDGHVRHEYKESRLICSGGARQ